MGRRRNPAAFEKSRRERDKKKKKQEKLAKKRERRDGDEGEDGELAGLRSDEVAEIDPAFLEDAQASEEEVEEDATEPRD